MKKVSLCLMLLISLFLTGCHQLCDGYTVDLPNNYEISSWCVKCAEICPQDGYNPEEDAYIPTYVEEIDWNNRYIIAKQYDEVTENNHTYIDEASPNYWILDTEEDITYGPYKDEKDFNNKKQELGIEKLKLKEIKDLKGYKKFCSM